MRMAATKQRILCQDYHGHVDCRQRPGNNGVSGSGLKFTWNFKMDHWKIMSLWRKWHSGIAILNIAVKIASVHVRVCGVKTLLWNVERIWWNDNEKVWMNDMNEYDEMKMKGCLWMIYGGDEVNNSWIISLEQLASLERDFFWYECITPGLGLDLAVSVLISVLKSWFRSLSLVIGRCWGRLIEWKDILHNHSKNRKPWQIT